MRIATYQTRNRRAADPYVYAPHDTRGPAQLDSHDALITVFVGAVLAQQTGKPIGEVELILSLKKAEQPADRPARIINSVR